MSGIDEFLQLSCIVTGKVWPMMKADNFIQKIINNGMKKKRSERDAPPQTPSRGCGMAKI